jgi:predicted aconitase with swiveling domain
MATVETRAPDVVIRGRKVVGGLCEGEALVTRQTISGWGGVNPAKGEIIETHHELRGQSFAGKILVFPGAKGSSGWSAMFHTTRLTGKAPIGLLYNITTTKAALGAVVMRVPTMTAFDSDPLDRIETGDWVRIDADTGTVSVWKGGRP